MINKCIRLLIIFLLLAAVKISVAQDVQKSENKEAEYTKAITQRANKIVSVLGINDPSKVNRVRDIIVQQYRNLNTIQQDQDAQLNEFKQAAGNNRQALEDKKKAIETDAEVKLDKLHSEYLSKLSKELNPAQIDKVKDGMTYNVLPITYKGYLDMLPSLTEKQKAQILAYLTEAREHAIDAGSSEKKHWWFGKYKGKINNYLSAEGIETKKAREDWEKRIKEQQSAAQ